MADANGQRFWQLTGPADWEARASEEGRPIPSYDAERRSYALGRYAALTFEEHDDEGQALARWAQPRTAVDAVGTFAYLDADSGNIHASGALEGSIVLHTPAQTPQDMAMAGDGVLHLIEGDDVVLVDLRDRWDSERLSLDNFSPTRLDGSQAGGLYVLDRGNRRVACLRGQPLPQRGLRIRAADVFDPKEENPRPPRLVDLGLGLAPDEDPIDIAVSDEGRVAVLIWRGADECVIRFITDDGRTSAAHRLTEVRRPYSLAWLGEHTLVTLIATSEGGSEVVTYSALLSDIDIERPPLGDVYPLPNHDGGPLARVFTGRPHYARSAEGVAQPLAPRKLVAISATFRAKAGLLETPREHPLDGAQVGFVWHRAQIEADLPTDCGLRLFAAASDDRDTPPDEMFEHVFGGLESEAMIPRGVWSPQASELPFHPGLIDCPSEAHRSGLFSVLLQRHGRRVSALTGRYLWLRVELEGPGHTTPELAALRVYGSRFSYVQRYLPRVYHESLVPPDADQSIAEADPSAADFLERFVCNFEGMLTPLEDRVANAHLLTDPDATPPEALQWLGTWVGMVFDAAYPEAHRREALRQAIRMHRWRGTLRGLKLAIDILTGGRMQGDTMYGGAVELGRVVILEGWRLRRTFSTLLGVDLADESDPLLGGVVRSGNSLVGDSLILGEEHRLEFLALMRRLMPEGGPPEGASVDEWVTWLGEELVDHFVVQPFLDQLAHRVLVLVHEDLEGDLVALIERIAALECPAHVVVEVSTASYRFIVGLASLVGVDSYLREPEEPPKIIVDRSQLGAGGFLTRPAALDRRLEGGR